MVATHKRGHHSTLRPQRMNRVVQVRNPRSQRPRVMNLRGHPDIPDHLENYIPYTYADWSGTPMVAPAAMSIYSESTPQRIAREKREKHDRRIQTLKTIGSGVAKTALYASDILSKNPALAVSAASALHPGVGEKLNTMYKEYKKVKQDERIEEGVAEGETKLRTQQRLNKTQYELDKESFLDNPGMASGRDLTAGELEAYEELKKSEDPDDIARLSRYKKKEKPSSTLDQWLPYTTGGLTTLGCLYFSAGGGATACTAAGAAMGGITRSLTMS